MLSDTPLSRSRRYTNHYMDNMYIGRFLLNHDGAQCTQVMHIPHLGKKTELPLKVGGVQKYS